LAARVLADGSPADLTAVVGEVFTGRPGAEHVPAWVRFALDPNATPPEVNERTLPFIESIAELRRIHAPGSVHGSGCRRRVIGRKLDFIGEPDNCDNWSPVQYLNYLLMSQIRPRRSAAVVGAMRDDGIYAIEWIAHHLSLGFEHVFIYTNDNADGSETLLRQLASHGVITLIESETSGTVPPEIKAFEHLTQLVSGARDFEWLLFVDSDEFLMPAARYENSVDNLLSALARRHPDRLPSAILFEWLWYVSGMVYERQPGLMLERFQHGRPHWLTKTLVRLPDLVSMRCQHYPELKAGRMVVDSAFEPFDLRRVWARREPCYDGGWVAHFWPKSFEEFSLKKARGDALKLQRNEYSRHFGLFFRWNGLETAENHHPPDPAFVARVKAKAAELRGLEGVTPAETEVESRFKKLIGRYDHAGGLRKIYEQSRREPGAL
jgi:hypothetical protein